MQLPENYVYLDWAATTPLCEEAAQEMAPYLSWGPANLPFGANANSLHSAGRSAFSALEDARRRIAKAVGAKRPDQIVLESGATEADNHAILGILSALREQARQKGASEYAPRFITSSIEHEAVLALLPVLRSQGIGVTLVDPDADGIVDPDKLAAALGTDTALVSIMAANNEVGSVNDIKALAGLAHEAGALFHTDATQAFGKMPVDFGDLGVDAASFSSHKVCGPKGIGALYLKPGTPITPQVLGGGQEQGRRSGTQNVMGAVGFAAACEAAARLVDTEQERLMGLRDFLYQELCKLPGVSQTVPCELGDRRFLPNIVHILVDGFESETLILQSDLAGFAVSGGSACSTGSLEPSHVLSAMGVPRDKALGALRISFGRYTTKEDVERFAEAFKDLLASRR